MTQSKRDIERRDMRRAAKRLGGDYQKWAEQDSGSGDAISLKQFVRKAQTDGASENKATSMYDEITQEANLPLTAEKYEADIHVVRKETELRVKDTLLRRQEAKEVKQRSEHNNGQIELKQLLVSKGIDSKTEKNYVDLSFLDFLGEMKIKPSKGDFEHAVGHLRNARFQTGTSDLKLLLVSLDRQPKTKALQWMTSEEVSVVSRVNGVYTLENRVVGHEELENIFSKVN